MVAFWFIPRVRRAAIVGLGVGPVTPALVFGGGVPAGVAARDARRFGNDGRRGDLVRRRRRARRATRFAQQAGIHARVSFAASAASRRAGVRGFADVAAANVVVVAAVVALVVARDGVARGGSARAGTARGCLALQEGEGGAARRAGRLGRARGGCRGVPPRTSASRRGG